MTPLQELCNAVTIVPPGALLVCAHWRRRPLLALAGALQTPAAFAYHASVARLGHRIDNDLRRLDQTMQHIAAVCLTYELSGCAVAYTLLAAAYAAYSVRCLWHPATSNDGRRCYAVLGSVFFYLGPVLCSPSVGAARKALAFGTMLVGGLLAFVPPAQVLGGWSHAAFHVLLVPHVWSLARP